MTTPHYGIWPWDLGTAREEKLRVTAGVIVFVDAVNAAGEFQPGALIEVSLSDRDQDFVPFYPGSRLLNKTSDQVRMKWAAQAGVTAKILIGEPDVLDLQIASRATVVVGSLADTITVAPVTVGTSVQSIIAANANRKRVLIRNEGAAAVFIGPTGVLVSTGLRLDPGEQWKSTTTNAEVFGISAAAGNDVRVLEETN